MTSNQYYLDAYPVLTPEWEDVFEGMRPLMRSLQINMNGNWVLGCWTKHPTGETQVVFYNGDRTESEPFKTSLSAHTIMPYIETPIKTMFFDAETGDRHIHYSYLAPLAITSDGILCLL